VCKLIYIFNRDTYFEMILGTIVEHIKIIKQEIKEYFDQKFHEKEILQNMNAVLKYMCYVYSKNGVHICSTCKQIHYCSKECQKAD
jgi:hypothetical protein